MFVLRIIHISLLGEYDFFSHNLKNFFNENFFVLSLNFIFE